MDELDSPPTIDELMKAIDSLACGKAPGSDGIPPEIVKAGREISILVHLHELLLQCWEEGMIPQDMQDAKIVTLYKNKGDRSDCNNYSGISLLSIVSKAFSRVVLNRLQLFADRVYPESQCGFRAKLDMVFTLRQLQEKCHDGMTGTVQYDGSSSDPFPIKSGVKQGCVPAPRLFGIFFSLLLRHAFRESEDGVFLHTRTDGNLLNLARLRARLSHKLLGNFSDFRQRFRILTTFRIFGNFRLFEVL